MTEKIQKIIARVGICGRREAEELIKAGRVTKNGATVCLGERADSDADIIAVDERVIKSAEERVYYIFNKPKGVVTSLSDDKGRVDLAEYTKGINKRVFPVGRLDMDSEGMLLLTNDGSFMNNVLHPSHEIVKYYYVRVTGALANCEKRLAEPVTVDETMVQADTIEALQDNGTSKDLLVGIHQGKNRQVRKMCAACGLNVLRLVRVAEGQLVIPDIKPGQMIKSNEEICGRIFRPARIEEIKEYITLNLLK